MLGSGREGGDALIDMPLIPLQPTPGGWCGQQSFSPRASVSADRVKDITQGYRFTPSCCSQVPFISPNVCLILIGCLLLGVFIFFKDFIWGPHLVPIPVTASLLTKLLQSPVEEISGSLATCSRPQTPIKASDHEPGMTLSQEQSVSRLCVAELETSDTHEERLTFKQFPYYLFSEWPFCVHWQSLLCVSQFNALPDKTMPVNFLFVSFIPSLWLITMPSKSRPWQCCLFTPSTPLPRPFSPPRPLSLSLVGRIVCNQ